MEWSTSIFSLLYQGIVDDTGEEKKGFHQLGNVCFSSHQILRTDALNAWQTVERKENNYFDLVDQHCRSSCKLLISLVPKMSLLHCYQVTGPLFLLFVLLLTPWVSNQCQHKSTRVVSQMLQSDCLRYSLYIS